MVAVVTKETKSKNIKDYRRLIGRRDLKVRR